jgi:hypothetical protein
VIQYGYFMRAPKLDSQGIYLYTLSTSCIAAQLACRRPFLGYLLFPTLAQPIGKINILRHNLCHLIFVGQDYPSILAVVQTTQAFESLRRRFRILVYGLKKRESCDRVMAWAWVVQRSIMTGVAGEDNVWTRQPRGPTVGTRPMYPRT